MNEYDRSDRELSADVSEAERQKAIRQLLSELEKGEKSAEERGWLTEEEAERQLALL